MKRTICLALTAIMTALAFTSCAKNDSTAPEGFKEISDDEIGYDLFVPEDWNEDISTGITAAYYSSEDPANISMMAFEMTSDVQSMEDYWEAYLPSLSAMFPDLKFENVPEDDQTEGVAVGEPEQLNLDGVPALAYNYTGTMNGVTYKFYQVISVKNATMYIFTYTAEIANYDSHIKDVVDILGNLKFH